MKHTSGNNGYLICNLQRILQSLLLCLIPAFTHAQVPDSSALSTGKWIKISVNKEGIYQLSKDKLSSLGFKDPAKVKLYGYGLEFLPESNIQNLDNDIKEIPVWRNSNGTLLFYSCGTTRWYAEDWKVPSQGTSQIAFHHRNNPYSNSICYFLTESDNAPAGISKEQSVEGATSVDTYPEHALIETDEFSYINTGRTFFEKYDFGGKSTKRYKLDLPGYAGGQVRLDVNFSAAGSNSSTLSVTVNKTKLGTLSFQSLPEYVYADVQSASYNWSNAHAVNDTIELTHKGASGTMGHLDYIRASYMRKLSLADNKFLVFRSSQLSSRNIKYNVSGANEYTRVWRITKATSTTEIPGTLNGNTYSVNAQSTGNDKFVAVNVNATYPEPTIIGMIENQNLRALHDIDLVIITPANGKLNAQAQKLADAHRDHDGIKCVVVSADKVYNEFSSGTPDATAYRRFMKMLYGKSSNKNNAPKNLCLFGDGIWDNRMVTSSFGGATPDDYLLCYESDNSVSHTKSYVLEEYFSLLDDNDGKRVASDRPDCGVGRIPVKTEAEAKAVVNKLIPYIYNKEAGPWRNTICMMADDGNQNIHMLDAESITSIVRETAPDMRIRKIYWDSYSREQTATGNSYPAAYDDINKQMEEGALVMNYTGHGAAYCLSHEQVLKRNDFARWDSPRLPLWVQAACDVSPFDMNTENIGETALLNEKGGAMGVITTTRTVYSSQNRAINRLFMKYALSSDGYTIGEALQMAKANLSLTTDLDSINKCHFVLLGDPAIRLAQPTRKIKIDEFNGHSIPLPKNTQGKDSIDIDTIGAGTTVTVKGHIYYTTGYSNGKQTEQIDSLDGTIYPTVFDCEESIVCKNNARDTNSPFIFNQRNKILYTGSDNIIKGRFTFTFKVPFDITYSEAKALMNLYAVSADGQTEANGSFSEFVLKGTEPSSQKDSIGPVIDLVLSDEGFTNRLNPALENHFEASRLKPQMPTALIQLYDTNGINTTGNGIGHDITLAIDNDPSQTYSLNNYFNYDAGSYVSGTIKYQIPSLSVGKHTLLIRAWDILNNSSTMTVTFDVVADYDSATLFDTSGREVWSGTGTGYKTELPKGIYILRTPVETKKILIK